MARSAVAGSTAIIVLGAPRSGTSALTGALNILGADVGERLLRASAANPRGYWEHADIVTIQDRLLKRLGRSWSDARAMPERWLETRAAAIAARQIRDTLNRDFAGKQLWAIKDPRSCRLVPLWQPLLRDLGVSARYILALRDPGEVIASLGRGIPYSQSYAELLWLRYVLEAERATRAEPRAIVQYRDLVGGAGKRTLQTERIARALGIDWPVLADRAEARLVAFLSPELRHERSDGRQRPVAAWVDEVAAAFAAGDGPALHQACDRALERVRQSRIDRVEQPEPRRRNWIARRRDHLRALSARAGERIFQSKNQLLRLWDRGRRRFNKA